MSVSRCLASVAAVLFLCVVALYLPTLRGVFVYDSIAQVVHSDYIHTSSHWVDVISLRVLGQDELDRNRPLFVASLMTDAAVWGRNPFGYRLTNVLLHALNTSLLFVFIATFFSRNNSTGRDERFARPVIMERACGPSASATIFAAAFGALLFALHPLVVEVVAEPSNREDLLVLLPVLIGLFGIVSPARWNWGVNCLLVISSFSAVLAKESGIAAPFVFAVACWLLRRDDLRKFAPGLIGGLVAAVSFLIASYVWRPSGSAVLVNPPQPLADSVSTFFEVQMRIWTLQFGQILWPWNLSAHYTAHAIGGITWHVAVAAMVGVVVAGFFAWRADRLAALGVAIYVLCLLPASNFAAQYHPIADRYLYVSLAGVGMIAASLVSSLRIKVPTNFAWCLICLGMFVLVSLECVANLRRQFIWQQPLSLWSDVLRQYPGLPQALVGMANAHYRAGDFQAARTAATEAVVGSSGRWADAWALRAVCEWQTGARDQAVESFRRARELSRAYVSEKSMADALVASPEQLVVLGELLEAAAGVR